MLSRDTSVHVRAVLLAFLVLFFLSPFDTGPATAAGFLLFYGLVFGGAHLYLAVRGENGLVPAEARWRYVATLVVLLVAGTAITYAGDRTVATVELRTVGLAVVAVATVAYLVAESVAGYRATRSG